MMKFKSILFASLITFLCSYPSFSYAETSAIIREETIEMANRVMMNIYEYLIEQQQTHRVLHEFTPKCLSKNKYGIYSINYVFADPYTQWRDANFEIGITIVLIDDPDEFDNEPATVIINFPLLGIKFLAYQKDSISTTKLDILHPIQKYGKVLWDAQQEFMPIQLFLEADKSKFYEGETIAFSATLQNIGKTNIVVKDLNADTLHFTFDQSDWNFLTEDMIQAGSRSKNKFLSPGASLKKAFKIRGDVHSAGEYIISASYIKTYRGIYPSASLKVIIEKPH